MMTSAAASAESSSNHPSTKFRVNDHGRLLGVATAALLLLGFSVLRLLIGAGDTPHVDNSSSDQGLQLTPQAVEPADEIHRMRPQTFEAPSAAAVYEVQTQAVTDGPAGWQATPIDSWPAEPQHAPAEQQAVDVAFGAELRR